MIGIIRVTFRFLFFILWTIYIIAGILLGSLFTKDKLAVGFRKRRQWAAGLRRLLGLTFIKKGKSDYKNAIFFIQSSLLY